MTIGRPPSYKPEYAIQAQKLCEFGATDTEVSDFFEVSRTTIWRWAAEYPEFCNALKAGKAAADERVERSLYHKAIGYSYDAVKLVGAEKISYREHVPPDTTACIFWLKNRRQHQWRDVHKHEHGGVGDFDKYTNEQLKQFVETGVAPESPSPVQAPTPRGSNGAGTKPH